MLNTFDEIRSKYNRAACLSLGVILRDAYQIADYAAIFMPAHYQDTKYKKIADKIQAAFSKNGVVYYSAIAADTTLSNCGLDEIDFEIGNTQNQDIGIAEALTVFHEAHARYVEMWIAEKQAENVVKMDGAAEMRQWAEDERQRRGIYFGQATAIDYNIDDLIRDKLNGIDPVYPCRVPWNTLYRTGIWKYCKPGQLIIIAARPGMGKTLMAMNLVKYWSENNVPGVFLSLEMTKQQIDTLHIQMKTDLDFDDDFTRLTEWQKKELLAAAKEVKERFVCEVVTVETNNNAANLAFIIAKLQKAVMAGAKWAIIDYLQLINVPGYANNPEQANAAISKQLKQAALRLQIPIIPISQLSRGPESRSDKHPLMSDLRYSGQIEQDADIVVFPFRPGYYDKEGDPMYEANKDVGEMDIAKHRGGKTGCVKTLRVTPTRGYTDPETEWVVKKIEINERATQVGESSPDNSAAIMNANRRQNDDDIPF